MRVYLACLALSESIVLYASYYAGVYLRFGGDLGAASKAIGSLTPRAAIFTAVAMLAVSSVGLYRARQEMRRLDTAVRIGTAILLTGCADAVLYYMLPDVSTGRGAQALALGVSFVGLLATRSAFYAFVGNDLFKRNVLVYGNGAAAASFTRLCDELGQRSFRIAGYVAVCTERAAAVCIPVVSRTAGILELARDLRIDEIVVALDDRRNCVPARELLDCRLAGVSVCETLTFVERETGRIHLEPLNPSWLIYGNGFRQGFFHKTVKRQFDIVASLLLLVIALPLLAIAAVAILIESKGKGGVLLRQERVGLHGTVFGMLKLRSMRPDAERDGRARWASVNDPRITRVGALIRRLRIDELPQIVNILKGEMSFVGPRPERPEFVEELTRKIPFYAARHCVKPGLTGWAQLCYPYGSSAEDAREKLQYDLFYVKKHSAFFDLLILLETLDIVIWGRARPAVTAGATPDDITQQHPVA